MNYIRKSPALQELRVYPYPWQQVHITVFKVHALSFPLEQQKVQKDRLFFLSPEIANSLPPLS